MVNRDDNDNNTNIVNKLRINIVIIMKTNIDAVSYYDSNDDDINEN